MTIRSICNHAQNLTISIRPTMHCALLCGLLHCLSAPIDEQFVKMGPGLFIYVTMVLHAATLDPASDGCLWYNENVSGKFKD